MSYGKPTVKSPYGDIDYSEELSTDDATGSRTGSGFGPPRTGQPTYPVMPPVNPPRPNYNYGTPQTPVNLAHIPQDPISEVLATSRTLTQEDILFKRAWQRDSLIYRVAPITVGAMGSMYYYNITKNRPHKLIHYSLLAISSYMVGVWSYAGEFRRRVAESQSTTPFMQAWRRALNLPQRQDNHGDFGGGQPYFQGSDLNQPNPYGSGYDMPSSFGYQGTPIYSGQQPPARDINHFQAPGEHPEVPLKHTTSYDELRAKNRGLSR